MRKTILAAKIGNSTVIKSIGLLGPKGSTKWFMDTLSDGRIVIYGPDSHGRIPNWVN